MFGWQGWLVAYTLVFCVWLGRCGWSVSGECICYAGYTGPDCKLEMAEETCECGQFEGDCQRLCDMLDDCSGQGR